MPPTQPAPPLEQLNFEQMTWLVNETSPDVFYRQADALERAANQLRDVADRFRRELRHIDEASAGNAVDRAVELSERVAAGNEQVLQAMVTPGYGALLRKAGDALAVAQQRIRDLHMQRGQQPGAPDQQPAFAPQPGAAPAPGADAPDAQRARQIAHDLCTAYADVGAAMTPLPGNGPGSALPGSAPMAADGPPGGFDHGSAGMRHTEFTPTAVGDVALDGNTDAPSEAAVLGRPAAVPARQEMGAPSVGGATAFGGTPLAPAGMASLPLAGTAGPTALGQQRERSRKRAGGMRVQDEFGQQEQPSVLGRESPSSEQRPQIDAGDAKTAQPDDIRPVTESSGVDRQNERPDVTTHSSSVDGSSERPPGGVQHATANGAQHATTDGAQHAGPPESATANVAAESPPPVERTASQPPPASSAPTTKVGAPSALDLGQVTTPSPGASETSLSGPAPRTAPTDLGTTSSGLPMTSTGEVAPGGATQPESGSGHQGHPMAPMMGAGMQPQNQSPRQANVPLGADPDSWEEGAGVPGTLGRAEPEVAEEEPEHGQSSEERVEEVLRDLREKGKIR